MIIFVSVKQKIISITLLLSFLVVLTHEMVPHHHHEVMDNEISAAHKQTEEHAHHTKNDHHEHGKSHSHDDSENPGPEHHQNFPLHFHSPTSSDYDFARAGGHNPGSTNLSPLIVVLHGHFSSPDPGPPDKKLLKYRDHSTPLFPSFLTGAIGSRAPPFHA